jgi:hypothetical protein
MIWSVLFLLAASPEAPTPTPTPVPAAGRCLGEVKLKTPPKDAGKAISDASGTAKPGSNDLPEREEVPKTRSVVRVPKVPDHVDRNGHDQGWWRERARAARIAVLDARSALNAARHEYSMAGGDETLINPGGGTPAGPGYLLQMLASRVDEAKERLEKARRDEQRLQEEARRADAYPGWLR